MKQEPNETRKNILMSCLSRIIEQDLSADIIQLFVHTNDEDQEDQPTTHSIESKVNGNFKEFLDNRLTVKEIMVEGLSLV
jgi:hypothetical protein